jgi:hypothetical protein
MCWAKSNQSAQAWRPPDSYLPKKFGQRRCSKAATDLRAAERIARFIFDGAHAALPEAPENCWPRPRTTTVLVVLSAVAA